MHIDSLDGLRGIAVAAVLLFHAGYISGGYLGVNLFFVLSGFLISRSLLADLHEYGRIRLGRFYLRRLRRLAPALLAMVSVVGISASSIYPDESLSGIRSTGFATLLYFANWKAIYSGQSYWEALSGVKPFEHTWSLSIEEQVYLVWPMVLVVFGTLLRRLRPATVLTVAAISMAVTSVAALSYLYGAEVTLARIYYGSDVRSFSVAVGAAFAGAHDHRVFAAVMRHRLTKGAVLVSAPFVVASLFLFDSSNRQLYAGRVPGFELLAGLMIATIVRNPDWVASRLLSFRGLVALGKISYGLYVWHWPVFVALDHQDVLATTWMMPVAKFGLSLALAIGSYFIIELPGRYRLGDRPWLLLFAASLLAASLALVAGTRAAPRDDIGTPTAIARTESIEALGTIPAVPIPSLPDSSSSSTSGRSPVVLVVGDSQAFELLYRGSGAAYNRLDKPYSVFLGCGIGPGLPKQGDVVFGRDLDGADCSLVIDAWRDAVGRSEPDLVLIHVGAWEVFDRQIGSETLLFGTPEWDEAVAKQIQLVNRIFSSETTSVAWMAAPCYYEGDGTKDFPERLEPARTAHWNEILRAEAASDDVIVLDYDRFTCVGPDAGERPSSPDFRWDGVHLTEAGAETVWEWIYTRPELRSVLATED
ncbi:MAG: acyltransferase family protein [Acidimicrobiales bacterium]